MCAILLFMRLRVYLKTLRKCAEREITLYASCELSPIFLLYFFDLMWNEITNKIQKQRMKIMNFESRVSRKTFKNEISRVFRIFREITGIVFYVLIVPTSSNSVMNVPRSSPQCTWTHSVHCCYGQLVCDFDNVHHGKIFAFADAANSTTKCDAYYLEIL